MSTQPRNPQQLADDFGPDDEPVTLDEILAESARQYEAGAVEAMRRADMTVAMDAAHRHPRVLSQCLSRLIDMCTLTQSAAAACIYSLPRGGKRVTGPSVRFAEMVASAWGSIDVKTTIVSDGGEFRPSMAVIVAGRAHDLQTNVITEVDTRRKVEKKKNAKTPDDDMVQLAIASCTSIAYRNAVLRAVPKALLEDALTKAKEAAAGKGTLAQKRSALLEYFGELGADAVTVLAALGRVGVADITLDDVVYMRGLATSIKEGAITLADAMRTPEQRAAATRGRTTSSPMDLGVPPASDPNAQPGAGDDSQAP